MTKDGTRLPAVAVAILLICIGLFAFVAVLLRLIWLPDGTTKTEASDNAGP
jgi:hypothetical protein